MILAGIDEAGYGPLLGPLVVGCCALSLPDETDPCDTLPDVWRLMRRVLSKTRNPKKLHVNDSKKVYSPSVGLQELERAVLAFAHCRFGPLDSLDIALKHIAPAMLDDLAGHAWYAPCGDCFPIEIQSAGAAIAANALAVEARRLGCAVAHLGAQVVCESRLNRMVAQTRNKASALFSIAATHLQNLLENFGDQNLTIVCDRQGGREHYGALLRLMFDSWQLEIETESEAHSEYRLLRNGHSVRVIFCVGAETRCLCTAVASMVSKYLREALMRRFNAYWKAHLPAIVPTAGYYNDGLRFLEQIRPKAVELGIADHMLVRSR